MRLIKFITFSHKLHGCSMYKMCDLGTTRVLLPFRFYLLPSPPVNDIYCTSLIRYSGYYFFHCLLLCVYYSRAAIIRGRCSFLWKASRHQQWLDKVRTSEAVTIDRRSVSSIHSLSSLTVSHRNDLYNTNSPGGSMVTIIRNYLCMCVRAVYTSCGYYLRVAFLSFITSVVRLRTI